MQCRKCRAEIPDDSLFCPACAAPTRDVDDSGFATSRWQEAGVVQLFAGYGLAVAAACAATAGIALYEVSTTTDPDNFRAYLLIGFGEVLAITSLPWLRGAPLRAEAARAAAAAAVGSAAVAVATLVVGLVEAHSSAGSLGDATVWEVFALTWAFITFALGSYLCPLKRRVATGVAAACSALAVAFGGVGLGLAFAGTNFDPVRGGIWLAAAAVTAVLAGAAYFSRRDSRRSLSVRPPV